MTGPHRVATLYYFGDLDYRELPQVAADALEQGFDGPSLRRLAGLMNPVKSDIRPEEVDCAFREMGVAAPIPRDVARLHLAADSAMKAVRGESNVFDEATHIAIHLCELREPPPELRRIVALSKEASRPRRIAWNHIAMIWSRNVPDLEAQLKQAMAEFLRSRE